MTTSMVTLPREYKLIVVGVSGVGKSALAMQLIENRFLDENDYIIHDGSPKQCIIDEEVALLDVLDISELREQYIRVAEGFLLVYSITSRYSLEEISTFHQQILRVKDKDSFPIIVVANKCDLEHERVVGINEGRDLAKQLGCKFMETSATYGLNVDEAFKNLVREIRKNNKKQQAGTPTLAGNGGDKDQPAPGCCGGCVVL